MSGFPLVFRALVLGPARRHPARVVLPVLGVAIGVAAVAAIHHANRSVSESFRDAAASIAGRSDFVVTGVSGVPVSALERLAFLWPVASFAPAVTGPALVDDGSGEIAQVLGIDYGGDAAVRDIAVVDSSGGVARLLTRGSVLVPVPFAARHRLTPGASFTIVAGGTRRAVTVAGLIALSGVARASGGDLLVTDVFTAQELLGRSGVVDRVDVVLKPGASREEITREGASRDDVAREIVRRLPPGLSLALPGKAAATADKMVRAFRFNLNALGSLTLLVGIFLITNAVSIAVLRRRPEIATLRALGATRGAVFVAFLAEGLTIGAAGTAIGEALGLLAARGALRAVGGTVSTVYLPAARITAAGFGGAAILAAAVGIAAALAATLLPAAEATRVPPAPALRPGAFEGVARRRLGPRTAVAAALLVAALAASRLPAVGGFPLFGFAAVGLVVAALALLAPLAVRGGAALLGRPLARAAGAAGRLASGFFGGALARNGIAVTALAMALGMTLAMIVTVASIRETVRVWVESTLRSDLWIKSDAGGRPGIVGDLPEDVVVFLTGIDGVAAIDPFRARDTTDAQGRPFTLASGDFGVVARIGGLPLLDGRDPRPVSLAAKAAGDVLVSEPYARRFGARPGGRVRLATPAGPRDFRVAAVYRDYSNDRGTIVMDRALYLALFGDRRVTSLAVLAAPGVDANDLRRRILARARGRYALTISTNRELRRQVLAIFDRTFAVTRSLELIAVAVAVLGVANALIASAVERRRSFGLLRAIGAAGAQIRRATLLEAFLTGLTGTAAAVVAGAAFAALLLGVVNPQSFGWTVALAVPVATLAGAAALVLAASVLAGIVPGRIAARVEPSVALAEE